MHICLIKSPDGYITGFISHIPSNKLDNYPAENLREISTSDYPILFYSLVGRNKVKEKNGGGLGVMKVAGLHLKDEGDFKKVHLDTQKRVNELNNLM